MFYTYNQNNSEGYFIVNDDVAHFIIIEANNEDEANEKMKAIVENYSDFCPCCGERWRDRCHSKKKYPSIWGKNLYEEQDYFYRNDEAIIYYLDGKKSRYKLK
ncbi:MAG: DUF7296 family protein [Clostridium sp.]|uniref:DUF7296 family protein n=1 Tax=Clostridium sp. TaxID=1506 RepID=UPI003F2FD51D